MTRAITDPTAITAMAKAMTEEQLQDAITGMADALRIWWWHDNFPRRNKPGLPDLILIGRHAEWWELKKETGTVRPDQRDVLGRLLRAGQPARIVRPMHLLRGDVERWLRGMR